MGAGWMKIQEWARRLGMGRYKYTLSYDSRDQENAAVCGILAVLGNKRSAVVRALIMDAVRRYGTDVFSKENVKVLLYLIEHTEVAGSSQQSPPAAETRVGQGFSFPAEKQVRKQKPAAGRKIQTAGELGYKEDREQDASLDISAPEATLDSEAGYSDIGAETGSGKLMDFLQVGMFEGQ